MDLNDKISKTKALLGAIERDYAPAAFANSFGAEDMVLTDLIAQHFRGIEIFTLDTGRLPQETYELMQRASEHYRRRIKIYFPRTEAVEHYVKLNGINGFYDSIVQRKECCQVRKVEPLQRALAGKKAWITGLRQEQALSRQAVSESAYDPDHGLHKFNPLATWSEAEVWIYIRTYAVPYNALHDKNYPSIGCTPCTRAVQAGDHSRAGRWWWEGETHKECGLHVAAQNSVNNIAMVPS
ncbi:MAG: phosphoadenylyl-sulfate reductase [Gammaproteobacteria bacterium]